MNRGDNLDSYTDTIQTAFDNGEYDDLLNENMISDSQATLIPCSWAIA
ncbi:hypothetical protein [Flavobacterium sp. CS20]|nr:hypothetical protein [Flavobacterium sp. CS20]QTY27748.1 hypothetical protein IGB25_04265 [Flavobacterium sp. CS20]